MRIGVFSAFLLLFPAVLHAQTERKVAGPTRLDWDFACRGVSADVGKLPAGYDSAKQKYQLFVPKNYAKGKPAGLVFFISPGDGPQGFKNWQKICETDGLLFASPYGAGNNVPPAQRTRIILDVLDDIRRNFLIDPDQTYLTGFSGGGRMACAIGFALPEYFAGIIPICGTNTISSTTYLRHRAEDRLSVAFITGEKDMNRKENEEVMYPWLKEIGVRSKVWVVPKMNHAIPSGEVLAEAHAFVAEDLKRRREDAKARPKLAVGPEDTPASAEQARRLLETGSAEIKEPTRTWRGVAMLQGVTQRWPKTESAREAQKLLKDALGDEKLLERIERQGADDEVKSLSAQARAMERFGNVPKAIEAWSLLAKNYEGMPIAAEAAANIKRLKKK